MLKILFSKQPFTKAHSLAVSPKGDCIAVGGYRKTESFYDGPASEYSVSSVKLGAVKFLSPQGDYMPTYIAMGNAPVSGLAFSSSGNRIAALNSSPESGVYDVNTGGKIFGFDFNRSSMRPRGTAFSRSGKFLIEMGYFEKPPAVFVKVYNADTGAVTGSQKFNGEMLNSATVCPNGAFVIAGKKSQDRGMLRFLNVSGNGQLNVKCEFAVSGEITSVAVSPRGQLVVSSGNWLCRYSHPKFYPLLEMEKRVKMLVFSPSGEDLAAASWEDPAVREYKTNICIIRGSKVSEQYPMKNDSICSAAFSPDGSILYAATQQGKFDAYKVEGMTNDLSRQARG